LFEGLERALGPTHIRKNGHPELCLPNTLSVSFQGLEANTLLAQIGDRVAASAGAACHADRIDVSAVIEAINLPVEWAMGTVRFSVGVPTTSTDIDTAVGVIVDAVRSLQSDSIGNIEQKYTDSYKLTRFTKGLGCACKVPAHLLADLLSGLPRSDDPAVLADSELSEDAAVYQLDDQTAIVQTLDFITPVVDDPFTFGQIAASNALSDIYAMGAVPRFGLNIVAFPTRRLPMYVLEQILRGAVDRAQAAGISLIGGHTIDDPEPKFGLAVTGLVAPNALIRNHTALPGDAIILTKALGTGIMTTAIKRGLATQEQTEAAIASMVHLNRTASEVMCAVGVNACTDVTGFGLLGHLREMALGSQVDIKLFAGTIPVLPGTLQWAATDLVPGGTLQNLKHVQAHVSFAPGVAPAFQVILADAQTSGGLLISVPSKRAAPLLKALHNAGEHTAVQIGTVIGPGGGGIDVDT
jgi:selenium donor protein